MLCLLVSPLGGQARLLSFEEISRLEALSDAQLINRTTEVPRPSQPGGPAKQKGLMVGNVASDPSAKRSMPAATKSALGPLDPATPPGQTKWPVLPCTIQLSHAQAFVTRLTRQNSVLANSRGVCNGRLTQCNLHRAHCLEDLKASKELAPVTPPPCRCSTPRPCSPCPPPTVCEDFSSELRFAERRFSNCSRHVLGYQHELETLQTAYDEAIVKLGKSSPYLLYESFNLEGCASLLLSSTDEFSPQYWFALEACREVRDLSEALELHETACKNYQTFKSFDWLCK